MAGGVPIVPAGGDPRWNWPGEVWPGGGGIPGAVQGPQAGVPLQGDVPVRLVPRYDRRLDAGGAVTATEELSLGGVRQVARVRLAIDWRVATSRCPVETRTWLYGAFGRLMNDAMRVARGFSCRRQQQTVHMPTVGSVKVVALAGGKARLTLRFFPCHPEIPPFLVVKYETELSAWRP